MHLSGRNGRAVLRQPRTQLERKPFAARAPQSLLCLQPRRQPAYRQGHAQAQERLHHEPGALRAAGNRRQQPGRLCTRPDACLMPRPTPYTGEIMETLAGSIHDTSTTNHLRSREMRKVIWGASLGTAFEWYDFFVYGALAAVLAPLFFPPSMGQ